MTQPWNVRIHKLVLSHDFRGIDRNDQRIILKHIRRKLSVDPRGYGKALRAEFKGYWRLRVNDYRVIYRIHDDTVEVLVIKIGIRRDDTVYRNLSARLQKLL